jgi:hypothetical protein
MATSCSSKIRATSRTVSVCDGLRSEGFRNGTNSASEWFGKICKFSEASFGTFPKFSEGLSLVMQKILSHNRVPKNFYVHMRADGEGEQSERR